MSNADGQIISPQWQPELSGRPSYGVCDGFCNKKTDNRRAPIVTWILSFSSHYTFRSAEPRYTKRITRIIGGLHQLNAVSVGAGGHLNHATLDGGKTRVRAFYTIPDHEHWRRTSRSSIAFDFSKTYELQSHIVVLNMLPGAMFHVSYNCSRTWWTSKVRSWPTVSTYNIVR